MNEPVNHAKAYNMFLTLKNEELKNVRTAEYESKDMVKRITKYIAREAKKELDAEDVKE
jgi:hypothetical protein